MKKITKTIYVPDETDIAKLLMSVTKPKNDNFLVGVSIPHELDNHIPEKFM